MIVHNFDRRWVPIDPAALQRRRIADRIGVSPALASTLAGLVYGSGGREDFAAVAALTANRTASCGRAARG